MHKNEKKSIWTHLNVPKIYTEILQMCSELFRIFRYYWGFQIFLHLDWTYKIEVWNPIPKYTVKCTRSKFCTKTRCSGKHFEIYKNIDTNAIFKDAGLLRKHFKILRVNFWNIQKCSRTYISFLVFFPRIPKYPKNFP